MKSVENFLLTHKWWRLSLPIIFVLIWLGLGGLGGPTFGKIGDVESNDQSTFLPASAESTQVQNLQSQFQTGDSLPAVLLVTAPDKLAPSQLQQIAALKAKLAAVDGVATSQPIIGPIPSQDGRAAELIVPVQASAAVDEVVQSLRDQLGASLQAPLTSYVTGPAGLSADLIAAFGGIDGILLLVALAAVFVILLLVYRSIILPIIVLLLDIFALSGAILAVYYLAKPGAISLNGQAQGILSILVIGASTDYSLLLISRYRESLGRIEDKWAALFEAIKTSIEPIAASAATVILALLCLLFSDLRSNQSLGPVAAIGIAFAFLAATTFLPALLAVFGRAAFWPVRPKVDGRTAKSEAKGLWTAVARFVSRRPRSIWLASSLILVVCALGLTQLQASGVSVGDTIRSNSNAVAGQQALAQHYPAGSGSPVDIVVPASQAEAVLSLLKQQDGLKDAAAYTGQPPFVPAPPLVKNDQVLLTATLETNPSSPAAEQTIRQLRQRLDVVSSEALVGGQTAIMLDTTETAQADLYKIVPIVLAVVLIILALLLRSLLAPLLLVISVMLSYAATLGVSAVLFNNVFGFAGSDPAVPLFGFVFLVALGIDYNIFLMSRVREEALAMPTRPAILTGLSVTGGVITSAGLVLAATFAALAVIPILFLLEIAFIVAFGVLLDTIIVRSLIVPALTYDIGRAIWWPSRLSRSDR